MKTKTKLTRRNTNNGLKIIKEMDEYDYAWNRCLEVVDNNIMSVMKREKILLSTKMKGIVDDTNMLIAINNYVMELRKELRKLKQK